MRAVFGKDAAPDAGAEKLTAQWDGDYKILKYKEREFIVGTKGDASSKIPMVGTRTLAEPKYADAVFPMTLSAQESYVIFDKTKKKVIVLNVVTCLKGRDTANSEKTDWVGEAIPASGKYNGDFLMIRKYDQQGPKMKAPYYSMGRDFPVFLHADHSCTVQYNYFGNVKIKLTAHEVADELLKKIVDDHDKYYRPKPEGE
ncbi:MAG TPA: hypothetical protein VKX17_03875 [Planctomycetota bacterium]|nr:hypothetical protein [Planctomycetota bacterium]